MTEEEYMEWLTKWFSENKLSFKTYVSMSDILREIRHALNFRKEEVPSPAEMIPTEWIFEYVLKIKPEDAVKIQTMIRVWREETGRW